MYVFVAASRVQEITPYPSFVTSLVDVSHFQVIYLPSNFFRNIQNKQTKKQEVKRLNAKCFGLRGVREENGARGRSDEEAHTDTSFPITTPLASRS